MGTKCRFPKLYQECWPGQCRTAIRQSDASPSVVLPYLSCTALYLCMCADQRYCPAGLHTRSARSAEPGALQRRLHHNASALARQDRSKKGCSHQGYHRRPEACAGPAVQEVAGCSAQGSHADPGAAAKHLHYRKVHPSMEYSDLALKYNLNPHRLFLY